MFKFHKQDLLFFIVLCQVEFGLGMLQMFMEYQGVYSSKWLLFHFPTFIPFVIFDEWYFRKIARFNGKWTLSEDKKLLFIHLLLYASICFGCILTYSLVTVGRPHNWLGSLFDIFVGNTIFFFVIIWSGILTPRGYWDFYLKKVGRKK